MNSSDILEHVDSFYNSAWDKLVLVGTIALGIVGIIAPVIIQWYQKRTLKISEENLRDALRKEIENSKNQLRQEIEAIILEKSKKVKQTLRRKVKRVYGNSEGGLFYVQGNGQLDDKNYFDATRSYAMAIDYYRKAQNFMAIQDLLPNLVVCLDKIKKSELDELKKSDDVDINAILVKVLNKDKYGAVRNIILDEIYAQYDYFTKPEIRRLPK
ncbi:MULTISPECIES: hypothetical protein [unclassified Flavobacterium]|uniref:hypothetical protein n=1 Tax=unclassified Flavobacterium TaxID=196869 RepID=UPI001F137C2D|nr:MULTISPECIES: hypothetical protein [unclassified Flavobacterium]UMY65434.1 hypothetical protein MKO97_13115 [Flavobacterium sp. HJ-32-4]